MPTSVWMTDLGDQIRDAREKLNLSQDELAEKVDMSRGSINSYENGKGNPEFQVIAKIAAALGRPFTVLGCTIGPEDVLRLPPPAEQLCLDFDRDHIFLAQVTIRPSKKSVVVSTVAQLSDRLA